MTMASLASYLSGRGYGPVEDATGLTGKYDIELHWVSADQAESLDDSDSAGPMLSGALKSQLGLRLLSRKGQEEILVIDSAEKTPAEN